MKKKLGILTALATIGLSAQAADAASLFQNINASPGLYFGATTESGNALSIDVTLFNVTAEGNPIEMKSISDRISFDIVAPAGFFVKSISYSENLFTTITPGLGATSVDAGADIAGTAVSFGPSITFYATQPYSLGVTDYAIPGKESVVHMSIDNALSAAAFMRGSASIEKLDATVTADLAPVPVPATLWLLGSAMAGLVSMRRKPQA